MYFFFLKYVILFATYKKYLLSSAVAYIKYICHNLLERMHLGPLCVLLYEYNVVSEPQLKQWLFSFCVLCIMYVCMNDSFGIGLSNLSP